MTVWQLAVHGRRGELDVAIELNAPTTVVIMGANGAGKSSLLSMILGTLTPNRGRIVVADRVLFDSDAKVNVAVESRRIGWVPQTLGLFTYATVEQHIRFAAQPWVPSHQLREHVDRHMHMLSLHHLATKRPGELSGGGQQRLALARALACCPQALVLDEPFAALDVDAHVEVRSWLLSHAAALSLPMMIVTHDVEDARACGHVVTVAHGRAVQ